MKKTSFFTSLPFKLLVSVIVGIIGSALVAAASALGYRQTVIKPAEEAEAQHEEVRHECAQQNVHHDGWESLRFQAVFHTLSFFWLDGEAVPAPAQVSRSASLRGRCRKPSGNR